MIGMLAERFVQPGTQVYDRVVLWARRRSRCVATFIMIIQNYCHRQLSGDD